MMVCIWLHFDWSLCTKVFEKIAIHYVTSVQNAPDGWLIAVAQKIKKAIILVAALLKMLA